MSPRRGSWLDKPNIPKFPRFLDIIKVFPFQDGALQEGMNQKAAGAGPKSALLLKERTDGHIQCD